MAVKAERQEKIQGHARNLSGALQLVEEVDLRSYNGPTNREAKFALSEARRALGEAIAALEDLIVH